MRNASNQGLDVHSRRFVSGETLPYLGRRVQMSVTEASILKPLIHFRHWRFEIEVPRHLEGIERVRAIRRAFHLWYSERARDRITRRVAYWSGVINRQPARVLIRDQKQRWASCSSDGTLRFNWRVVMADPSLVDYVVVHELAHLEVKAHSSPFWNLVAAAMPDYAVRRRRLREVGPTLFI
jgi:predicted metal-dependent hydrolase